LICPASTAFPFVEVYRQSERFYDIMRGKEKDTFSMSCSEQLLLRKQILQCIEYFATEIIITEDLWPWASIILLCIESAHTRQLNSFWYK
jgi:uncharacterized Fe-S cluster-containing radical SAM superfamily protein